MPLGVINGTARLEEHDPMWARMAKDMILELRTVLGKDAIDIQHVGSTSIRGIPAKPLLDIAVAVDDVSVAEKYIEPLAEHGLHYMGEIVKEQRLFCKSTPGCDDRTHHIHFVQYGSTRWTDYLNFRDYCNTHPDVAKAYADLKRDLAERYANDRIRYRDSKHDFIVATLKQAAAWRASTTAAAANACEQNTAPAGLDEQMLMQAARENLMVMSRTARGILDVSTSKDKADVMQVTDADEAARLAAENYDRAIRLAWREKDRQFADAASLQQFVEQLAREINRGILKSDVLYRAGADAEKKMYCPVADMQKNVAWFYKRLFDLLRAEPYDPLETAAFTEYYMNTRIHMWADGCCKTSMACAAYMMLRSGCLPVRYRSRTEMYAYEGTHRMACDSEEDRTNFRLFATYYRTLSRSPVSGT